MTRGSYRFVCLCLFILVLASCSSNVRDEVTTPGNLDTSATTSRSLTVKVSLGSDDAEQDMTGGGVALINSRLPFGVNSGARTVGMRFYNVTIPKDATITSAVLEVKASASISGTTNFTVIGEAADNTPTYTTGNKNISARTKTSANVNWKPTAWTNGTLYRSPELKGIVQQIVIRNGWQSGNALALQVTGSGTRKAASFESGAANAPKLIVSYTTTTTDPPPPPPSGPCDALTDSVLAPWQSLNLSYASSINGKAAQTGSIFEVCGVAEGYLTTGFDEAMHYVSQPLDGNGMITVKVTSLEAGAEAGVFFQGVSAYQPEDAAAGLFFKPGVAPQLESYGDFSTYSLNRDLRVNKDVIADVATALRTPTAAPVTPELSDLTDVLRDSVAAELSSQDEPELSAQASALTAPQWLRIKRVNQTVTAYSSSNGTSWQEVGSTPLALARNLRIGLTAASGNPDQLSLARFESVTVEAQGPFVDVPAPLPPPWARRDIGPVGTAGSSLYNDNDGTFVVSGSGNGTAGTDAQHFVYHDLSGDGTLIAEIPSLDSGSAANLQAGLMLRKTLDAGSPYGFLSLGLDGTASFTQAPLAPASNGAAQIIEERTATNAMASLLSRFRFSRAATTQPNRWLMLTREGGTLIGYVSDNNETWQRVGTATLTLDETVYLGLAVNSSSNNLATATFQNVSVSPDVVVPILDTPVSETLPTVAVEVASNYSNITFTPAEPAAVTLSATNPVWNTGSRAFSADVTLTNTSSSRTYNGMRAVLSGFNPTTVTSTNPAGYTSDDKPFLEFGTVPPNTSKTLSWKFNAPEGSGFNFTASLIETDGVFDLTSASPTSLQNDTSTTVTVSGQGIRAETSFFIQSTKLTVQNWSATSASVVVPVGFPAATYGLMAVNPDGSRATLYPAFTVIEGAPPPPIDPIVFGKSFIDGYVRDYATGQGIAGAKVSIPGLETTTSDSGSFLLRGVPPGQHAVKIEAQGYEPVYRFAEVTQTTKTLTLELATLERKDPNVTRIGSEGGTHRASNGAFLVIPPGALDADADIQFTHTRAASTLPELPEDGYYLAFAHLGPAGLTFNKPATLFLPLRPNVEWTPGKPIRISYFDEKDKRWVQDITSGVITEIEGKLYLEYEINHFTWIGGQGPSVPVSGQVLDSNGAPAAGLTTNFGITDANGNYRGSSPGSSSGGPVDAYVVGYEDEYGATGNTDGSQPIEMPDIVVEVDLTPKIDPPVYIPGQSCGVTSSIAGAFNTQRQTFQATGGVYNQLVFRETTALLETGIPNFGATNTDMSGIRVVAGGQDITDLARIDLRSDNYLDIKLDLLELDLPSGVDIETSIEVLNKAGQRFSSAVNADIVAGVRVPNVNVIIESDADVPADVSTPYIEETEQGLSYTFRESDLTRDGGGLGVRVEVPIRTVDNNGQVLPIDASNAFNISGVVSDATGLTAGVAQVPVAVSLYEGAPTEYDLSKVVVSEGFTGLGYGSNQLEASGVAAGCGQELNGRDDAGRSPKLNVDDRRGNKVILSLPNITVHTEQEVCTLDAQESDRRTDLFSEVISAAAADEAPSRQLVIADQITDLSAEIENFFQFNQSQFELFIGDNDVSDDLTFEYVNDGAPSASTYRVKYTPDRTLPVGANIPVTFKGLSNSLEEFESTTILNVIGSVLVNSINLVPLPEDYRDYLEILPEDIVNTPTVAYSQGYVNILYKPGEVLTDFLVQVPVVALDETGEEVVPANLESVSLSGIGVESGSVVSGTAEMINGIAFVPLRLTAPDPAQFKMTTGVMQYQVDDLGIEPGSLTLSPQQSFAADLRFQSSSLPPGPLRLAVLGAAVTVGGIEWCLNTSCASSVTNYLDSAISSVFDPIVVEPPASQCSGTSFCQVLQAKRYTKEELKEIYKDPPLSEWPTDPLQPPEEEGWEWKGQTKDSKPGDVDGAWFRPTTKDSLKYGEPDAGHTVHWDWQKQGVRKGARWYPDGRIEVKP